MSENVQVGSFYNYLISQGYYFDKKLIENYLLSLKVKPFEILTGNSGTGKTKLSQLFAQFVSTNLFRAAVDNEKDKYVKVIGKGNYSSWANMGWTLDKKYFTKFLPINECESKFNMKIDGFPVEGSISLSVHLTYNNDVLKNHLHTIWEKSGNKKKYSKDGVDIDILIDYEGIKRITSGNVILDQSITFTQTSNKSAYEDRQWTTNHDIFNYLPFERGNVDCKIVIDGIKSDAKLRILSKLSFSKNNKVQKYLKDHEGEKVNLELMLNDLNFDSFIPDYTFFNENGEMLKFDQEDVSENKYQIVPVGANWTDNTNIVGYHNVLINDYQSTPAYELIKKAEQDPENPYFLILDEMNLSHVERYFADFLSAIESGEEIPLYGNDETLKLPDNLFIIGTVNVDETTYMFSPKVLDRANTIEFDTVLACDYMSSNDNFGDFEGDIDYLQAPLIDSNVSKLNISELKDLFSDIYCDGENLWDKLSIELTAFQETLKGSGFDFGFRVINEILRFMVVAYKYEGSPENWQNWERYFDAQIKQKILPKLHGSEKAIGVVLTNLFNICLVDRNNNENPKNSIVHEEDCRYYTSALKIKEMARVLSDQRYVSFIN